MQKHLCYQGNDVPEIGLAYAACITPGAVSSIIFVYLGTKAVKLLAFNVLLGQHVLGNGSYCGPGL